MKRYKLLFGYPLLALCMACSNDDGSLNIQNINKNDKAFPEACHLEIPAIDHLSGDIYAHYAGNTLNFVVDWNKEKQHSRWVAFTFTDKTSVKNWNRNNWEATEWGGDPFQPDPLIPEGEGTDAFSFYKSGYNRGHLCASEDRVYSKQANEQTFYMSNMSPQQGRFNANDWADLEMLVRNNWGRSSTFRDTLFVVKGGTIRNDQIMKYISDYSHPGKQIAVPKYYFMALLCKKHNGTENTYKAIGFWVEHKSYGGNPNLREWAVSIDKLEEYTGIDFFCNLPDRIETPVERTFSLKEWNGL